MGVERVGELSPQSQISQHVDRATAKTADRNLMAVTAVPKPGATKNYRTVTIAEDAAIRGWLARIEETDEAIINLVVEQCRSDADALRYFLLRAAEVEWQVVLSDFNQITN